MHKDIVNDSSPLYCNAPMIYQNVFNSVKKILFIVNLSDVVDPSVILDAMVVVFSVTMKV